MDMEEREKVSWLVACPYVIIHIQTCALVGKESVPLNKYPHVLYI